MATCSTNVWWAKEFQLAIASTITASPFDFIGITTVTSTPEPSHECDVIQRMSEAFRAMRREGLIK